MPRHFRDTVTVDITSVDDLFDLFKDMSSSNAYSGYRGHEDTSWKLQSSLWRFIKSIESTFGGGDKYDEVSNSLIENYKRNMLIHSDLTSNDIKEIDIWQYAQHYDLPTPLLDWTYSPYIALFFAVRQPQIERGEKDTRCVWVLDYATLNTINRTVEDEIQRNENTSFVKEDGSPDFESTAEYYPTLSVSGEVNGKNKRLYYQQGFFTRPGKLASIEVWLDRISQEFKRPIIDKLLLTKFEFECTESTRLEILSKLELMNINYKTLFPDGYGSAKDAVARTYMSYMKPRTWSISFSSEKGLTKP